jgi:hypothetical protein
MANLSGANQDGNGVSVIGIGRLWDQLCNDRDSHPLISVGSDELPNFILAVGLTHDLGLIVAHQHSSSAVCRLLIPHPLLLRRSGLRLAPFPPGIVLGELVLPE